MHRSRHHRTRALVVLLAAISMLLSVVAPVLATEQTPDEGDPRSEHVFVDDGCEASHGDPYVILTGPDGDQATEFVIEATMDDRQFTSRVTVSPGERSREVRIRIVEDGVEVNPEGRHVRVRVTADNIEHFVSFTVRCYSYTSGIEPECDENGGRVVVEMTNPSNNTDQYEVRADGDTLDTGDLGPGTTEKSYDLSPGDHVITVLLGGSVSHEETVTVPDACSLTIEVDHCESAGEVPLTLSVENGTDESVKIMVSLDEEDFQEFDAFVIGPESGDTREYAVADGPHRLVVTADGVTQYDEELSINCTTGAPTARPACGTTGGGIVIEVPRHDVAGLAGEVLVDGGVLGEFETLLTDQTLEYELPDGSYEVEVVIDGSSVLSRTVEVTCDLIVASGCEVINGPFEVTITNPTDEPVDAEVSLESTETDPTVGTAITSQFVTVPASDSATAGFGTIPDGDYTLRVTSRDGVDVSRGVTVDCTDVAGAQDVREGCEPVTDLYEVSVDNTNGGAEVTPIAYLVFEEDGIYEAVSDPGSLQPGSVGKFVFDVPDGDYVLVVRNGDEVLFEDDVTVDCTDVRLSTTSQECITEDVAATYEVRITDDNEERRDATVVLTYPNGSTQTRSGLVGENTEEVFTFPVSATGTYSLRTTIDGEDTTDTITIDETCLPEAGLELLALGLFAVLLMLIGTDMVLGGELRRRTRRRA